MRPTLPQMFLRFASIIAERSTCERGNVGCLITTPDMEQILAFGYNGTIKGFPNQCDDRNQEGNCGCIHAEVNALVKMPKFPGAIMFSTTSPCPQCTKLVVNAGIRQLYFWSYYRINTVPLLMKCGIRCVGPFISSTDGNPELCLEKSI